MRIRTLLACLLLGAPLTPAVVHADPPSYAQTVSACGTPNSTVPVGTPAPNTQDRNGKLCTSAAGGSTSIAANLHCQTTALAASLVCGSPATALVDFSVTPDSTLAASGYFIIIMDAAAVPSPGTVVFEKCYQVPSSFGAQSYGATFNTGGVAQTSGLVILVSTGANCQTYTASTHALAIAASYQ